jgi:hypothetical protein
VEFLGVQRNVEYFFVNLVTGEHSESIAMAIVVAISTVYIAVWLLVGVTV